jgi:DNA-binding transcriptional regulator YiaG
VPDVAFSKVMIKLDQWIARNPLVVFRTDQRVSRAMFATIAGVGVSSMRDYEKGRTLPPLRAYVAIARVMNMKPEELRVRWEAWHREKPGAENLDERALELSR